MKNTVIVIFLIFMHSVYAQNPEPDVDQVYLDDGTILLGKIILENDQLLKLKIKASDQIISITQKNIVKIIKNEGRFYFYRNGKYDYLKTKYSLELAYRVQPSRGKIERSPVFSQFHFDQEIIGSEVRIFFRSLVRFNVELN